MQTIDLDRVVAAKFAFEEAMNAAFHDSHERLTETSISLPVREYLDMVKDATGILPTVKHTDDSGNPVMRHIVYNGCSFYCHEYDPVPGGERWTTSA